MLDELLPYYERELGFLRDLSGEFAQRFPKIARRLAIEGDQCEDPHVERLMEGFAFLSARIHRKLDDEYPEITESFLDTLYPQYLRPSPSSAVLQMELDPAKPEIQGRYTIPRHFQVLAPEVQGVRCRFRTAFETHLWPVSVEAVRIELSQGSEQLRRTGAAAAVTVDLRTHGQLPWGDLGVDRLRFFLDGDTPLASLLYELLRFRLKGVRVSDGREDPDHCVTLPPSCLRPVGFEPDEAMLGGDLRFFDGFRLVQEYFLYPDKFFFMELEGLEARPLQHGRDLLRIQFLLDRFGDGETHHRLMDRIGPDFVRLGCTPILNLFPHAGEPIRVTHRQDRYPVVADARRPMGYEVYSVERVTRSERDGETEGNEVVPAFYAAGIREPGDGRFFWLTQRQRSVRANDRGTEMQLCLVDLGFRPVVPEQEVLSLDLLCTNRDLPELIPFGGSASTQGDFTVPLMAAVKRARLLRKPTASRRPPLRRGLQWKLVSHLSLNHLSLLSKGLAPLREALGLYNFSDSQALGRQIQGIRDLETRVVTGRLKGPGLPVYARGIEVTATLDEMAFVGANIHLFAGILQRFLASFSPPNSFLTFRMKTLQHPEEVLAWPPRAGERASI